MTKTGKLSGIARHDRPRGPMETLETVAVSVEGGLRGDYRGAVRPGKKPRRQVSLIEEESWKAAIAELSLPADRVPGWQERRANLLVSGLRFPREEGTIVRIGESLRIEITMECDPCSRMDELVPGLKAVLTPDWRGGVLGRVLTEGEIAVGDDVTIEPAGEG